MLRRRQLIIDYNEIVWNAGQSNGFQPRSKDDEDLDGDEGDAQICSECGSLTVLQRYLFHRQRRFKVGSVEFYSEVELLTHVRPHRDIVTLASFEFGNISAGNRYGEDNRLTGFNESSGT